MHFVFAPPAEAAAGLLTLPWREPLIDWQDERLVEIPHRGLSRHVVRFVAEGDAVFACKELPQRIARREYDLLRRLAGLQIPRVEALGVVVDRPGELDAILVTRFLEYSSPYRALFANPRGGRLVDPLLDAQAELLVRLHLVGFMWGDCSLSNTLFRLDAGALAAYLVDAETGELHGAGLSDGQRAYDIATARENVGGELLDLAAAGLLPPDLDPVHVIDELERRYRALWDELTREELIEPGEQRYRITERVRRLHELGFDVDEVELTEGPAGDALRLRTRVAEPGHHRRRLFALTGLDVEENQARRLLADIAGYRAHLERLHPDRPHPDRRHPDRRHPDRHGGRSVPEAVAAARWFTEVYRPVVEQIVPELRGKLGEAEVFHEVLEHRWFLSEAAGRDIGTGVATRDYLATVLPRVPDDLVTGPADDTIPGEAQSSSE